MINQKIAITLLIVSVILFIILSIFIVSKNAQFKKFDLDLTIAATKDFGLKYKSFFEFFTRIGNPVPMSALLLSLSGILFLVGKKKEALAVVLSAIIGLILFYIFKHSFQKDRPELWLVDENGYGFPSGHTTMSFIFFLSALFFISPLIKIYFFKIVFNAIAFFIFFIIATSRITLGVHYVSDILGGMATGTFSFVMATLVNISNKWFS